MIKNKAKKIIEIGQEVAWSSTLKKAADRELFPEVNRDTKDSFKQKKVQKLQYVDHQARRSLDFNSKISVIGKTANPQITDQPDI